MTPFLPSPSTAEAATGQTSTERRAGIARLNLGFWRRASKSSKSPRSAESEQGIVSVLQDVASLSLADALASMGSRLVGLYQDEVSERQQRYGFNKVKDDDSVHFWRLLFPALANPVGHRSCRAACRSCECRLKSLQFSILLTALAIIAIATGDHATFTVMLLMVIITTVLRLWQDYKSLVKASKLASCLSSPVGTATKPEEQELTPCRRFKRFARLAEPHRRPPMIIRTLRLSSSLRSSSPATSSL
jgi:magnesium-transporting ATPase (P-type)